MSKKTQKAIREFSAAQRAYVEAVRDAKQDKLSWIDVHYIALEKDYARARLANAYA